MVPSPGLSNVNHPPTLVITGVTNIWHFLNFHTKTCNIFRACEPTFHSCPSLFWLWYLTGCVELFGFIQNMSWGTLGTVRPFSNFHPERDVLEIQSAVERKGRVFPSHVLWMKQNVSSYCHWNPNIMSPWFRCSDSGEDSNQSQQCSETSDCQDLWKNYTKGNNLNSYLGSKTSYSKSAPIVTYLISSICYTIQHCNQTSVCCKYVCAFTSVCRSNIICTAVKGFEHHTFVFWGSRTGTKMISLCMLCYKQTVDR